MDRPFFIHLYFEHVIGEGLQAFTNAEHAWSHMADRAALDRYLRSLEAERLQDVIASLEVYEEQFAPDHLVPGSVVLLNLWPEVPERERGMFGVDTRRAVGRVIYRLIRSLTESDAIEAAVPEVLPHVTTLSAKAQLITMGATSIGLRMLCRCAAKSPPLGAVCAWADAISTRDHILPIHVYTGLRFIGGKVCYGTRGSASSGWIGLSKPWAMATS
jgi:hypothetical protein